MKVATVIYRNYLRSNGIEKIFWHFIRRNFVKFFNDPVCELPIHGRLLNIPLSHELPNYIKQFRFYDQLPKRISQYIHQKQGFLICIDVGANIGDSIAAFYMEERDIFLAIEPSPKFSKLLIKNWSWNKNVKVVFDICSSSKGEETFKVQEKNGTASVLKSENGKKMKQRKLDEIVKRNIFAINANLLKIDTDGHDFEVIEGSKLLISNNIPAVLYECDVFENASYVEDCIKTLLFFNMSGYNYFLLYDNFGHLMGKYSLSDLSPFKDLLFYQLTSNFYYFDILLMKDEDLFQFYKAEIDYFTERIPNKSLQQTANTAADFRC